MNPGAIKQDNFFYKIKEVNNDKGEKEYIIEVP
jgi:hypothetical protein